MSAQSLFPQKDVDGSDYQNFHQFISTTRLLAVAPSKACHAQWLGPFLKLCAIAFAVLLYSKVAKAIAKRRTFFFSDQFFHFDPVLASFLSC